MRTFARAITIRTSARLLPGDGASQAGLLIISHKDSLTNIPDRVYLLEQGVTCPLSRPLTPGILERTAYFPG